MDTHGGLDLDDTTPDFAGSTNQHNPGYTFNGWKPVVAETVTDDVTYVAQWTPNENTKYTVEYYYQQLDGKYPTDADDTDEREGTTDTTASLTDADKLPGSDGVEGKSYALAENLVVDNQNIAGDGSTVLKAYFKLQFTVTYLPGTKGTFDEESTKNLDYGAETPEAPDAANNHADGYTFAGWSPAVAETVTDDVTYVAQWTANSNTKYTVEYYYQQMDGKYPTDADATAEREGTTDTTASLTDADKMCIRDSSTADKAEHYEKLHAAENLIMEDARCV